MKFDTGDAGPIRIQHLEGWTLLRLRTTLDAATSDALQSALDSATGPVVVDLASHTSDDPERQRLADAVAVLATPERDVLVVSTNEPERHALRALGVAAYESLDAAVDDSDAPFTRQEDRHDSALPPSTADTTTVSAEDLLGGGDTRRA
jgi:hypothetical protein